VQVLLIALVAILFSTPIGAAERYEMGAPLLKDIWVDPARGSDANAGTSKTKALRTLRAAWERAGNLDTTGICINILPGTIPFEEGLGNYFEERRGTLRRPLIIRAAQGPRTVTIQGGMNIAKCNFLYLVNLKMVAGRGTPTWGNNVLHLEQCDHVLMRGISLAGPDPATNPDNYDIQETLKANQCSHIYLEDSDISGAYQTGVDFFSVQHGHIISNRVHGTGEWGMYLKGGSAYFIIDGNEIKRCRLGFQAGEGSNLTYMRAPWVHYDVYDIKFTNNVLHHIPGVGIGVSGGYNVLFAYNTLYKVAVSEDPGYPLLLLTHGARSCETAGEGRRICERLINSGAWGSLAAGGEWIPNRNVYVYNNIFYNPSPLQTRYAHLDIQAAAQPPRGSNVPAPSLADAGAQFKGNIIWNGPPDHPLGLDNASSQWLSEEKMRAENAVNTVQPRFVDPESGDFHLAGGSLPEIEAVSIPDFSWDDAPSPPAVPPGKLSNAVHTDREGRSRAAGNAQGAYLLP
jgi:hypothetical protein